MVQHRSSSLTIAIGLSIRQHLIACFSEDTKLLEFLCQRNDIKVKEAYLTFEPEILWICRKNQLRVSLRTTEEYP